MRVKGASGDQILREKALADRDGLLLGTTMEGQELRQMGVAKIDAGSATMTVFVRFSAWPTSLKVISFENQLSPTGRQGPWGDFFASLVCGPSPAGGCERSGKQLGVAKRAASVFTLDIVAAIVAPGSTLRAVPFFDVGDGMGARLAHSRCWCLTRHPLCRAMRAAGPSDKKGHPPAVG